MDLISSVSHVILTHLEFLHIKTCVICIVRREKTVGGLNPGPLTLHAVVLPLRY